VSGLQSGPRVAVDPLVVETGVVAVLRAAGGTHLPAVTAALVAAGITCLELTMTTPAALETLASLPATVSGDAGAVLVGMGSVTCAEQAEAALAAGARFLVSPGWCPDVVEAARAAGRACYPGAWTPTEVLGAWRSGASAVKIFPAAVAGPAYLRHLAGPLPDIPLMPTGGIDLADVAEYVAAGAVAVGLGSPLLGDALAGGSLAALAERAARALAGVAAGRARRGGAAARPLPER
jgi:2-dehydro-3-deoxyphosphogluconate aldolase/(4S)-4-hydroxy-2-oxoglutarate aldolase